MKGNNKPGETLIERLRFCPVLTPIKDFDGFAVRREDMARLLSSRTEAAELLQRLEEKTP